MNGSTARYEVQGALNYIGTEVHSNYGPLFYATTPEEVKTFVREKLSAKFTYLNNLLNGKKFIVGDSFTIADSYLSVVLSWSPFVNLDLSSYPNITAYIDGIQSLPEVKTARAHLDSNPSSTL